MLSSVVCLHIQNMGAGFPGSHSTEMLAKKYESDAKFASKFQSIVELSSSCSNSFSSLIDSTSNMENENENLSECLNGLTTKKASCSPLFFVVKGCKVVSIVQGANFPALSKSIYEHLPSLSDDEIIEDGA